MLNVRLWITTAVLLLILGGLVFLATTYGVSQLDPGPSPISSISPESMLLVRKRERRVEALERGNVVQFRVPGTESIALGRVLALPGETVACRGGKLFLNVDPARDPTATPLTESWLIAGKGQNPREQWEAMPIPAGHVFLLADDRVNPNFRARDSRALGPIPEALLLGQVASQ